MNKTNKVMIKKGLLVLGIILVVSGSIYLVTDYFNKNYIRRDKVAINGQTPDGAPARPPRSGTVPPPKTLSPEKQEILNASISNIKQVMASKDVKKIRALLAVMYPDKNSVDTLNKTSDVNVLKSAQMFTEYNVAKNLMYTLPALPDSAWNITTDKATIVQDQAGGRKAYYYATKVDGVWK
jgi:hypothetical protein